jgi:threonine aldolase
VLCFGGTKNGMNMTEAVVFFNRQLARGVRLPLQAGRPARLEDALPGSQWVGMLQDGAWLRRAAHANHMTQKLAAALRRIPQVKILVEPEVNAVFAEHAAAAAEAMHAGAGISTISSAPTATG